MKKRVLLVGENYPCEGPGYYHGFIHSRVLLYKNEGLVVDVFSYDYNNDDEYNYDGIKVTRGGFNKLSEFVRAGEYDVILVHFGWKKMMKAIFENKKQNTRIIQWVHGVEALAWYRRLFNFSFKDIKEFLRYLLLNVRQIIFMRKLILNQKKYNHTFVFVSNWMKNILEKDTFTVGKIRSYKIIPNVFSTKEFKYISKKATDRFNVYNLRPYSSRKYANDITVKTILELSNRDVFSKLRFTLIGDGELFDKTVAPIKKFNNVKLKRKFLDHKEIALEHKKNGILLMPTRQDAQGVSMCEAMGSGLVPVVSNNTAIPEFCNNNVGYLCDNYKCMADAIEDLVNNDGKFLEKSKKASEFIIKKCSEEVVIKAELDLILNG